MEIKRLLNPTDINPKDPAYCLGKLRLALNDYPYIHDYCSLSRTYVDLLPSVLLQQSLQINGLQRKEVEKMEIEGMAKTNTVVKDFIRNCRWFHDGMQDTYLHERSERKEAKDKRRLRRLMIIDGLKHVMHTHKWSFLDLGTNEEEVRSLTDETRSISLNLYSILKSKFSEIDPNPNDEEKERKKEWLNALTDPDYMYSITPVRSANTQDNIG